MKAEKRKKTPYRNYLGTADGEKVHRKLYFWSSKHNITPLMCMDNWVSGKQKYDHPPTFCCPNSTTSSHLNRLTKPWCNTLEHESVTWVPKGPDEFLQHPQATITEYWNHYHQCFVWGHWGKLYIISQKTKVRYVKRHKPYNLPQK